VDGFDPDAAAAELTGALWPLGSAARAEQEKRYLKSDLEFIGVTVPDLRRAVKAAVKAQLAGGGRRGARLDRETAVAWALALWREPVHERRAAAVGILQLAVTTLDASDLATVERLIRASRTWAYVDVLAGNIGGAVALRDPSAWERIDAWATDEDFWVRRSALLALLPGIRAGRPDLQRFTRYADPMLAEKEFFIRKAIGWVLRETSRREPQWVATWTAAHLAEISGVTFREAVRRLPPEDKARLEQRRAALAPLAVRLSAQRGRWRGRPVGCLGGVCLIGGRVWEDGAAGDEGAVRWRHSSSRTGYRMTTP
jgi:3-methyladenine DNA glycosylase AlkD